MEVIGTRQYHIFSVTLNPLAKIALTMTSPEVRV